MRCQEKTVLITGASNGIGRACAQAFASAGANLILCGRNESRLKKLADSLIADCGVKVLTLQFDVSDMQAVETQFTQLDVPWQDIDILINNAGLALGYDKLYAGDLQEWDKVIDTNIKSVVYMTRFIVARMIKRNQGHVINIGSVSSHATYSGGSVYCASKYAVRGLTETLRLDVLGTPIRVSLIDPGLVKTDFFDVRLQGDRNKIDALFAGMTPLGAEDVADAVLYCATRPAHVNVQEITVTSIDQAGQTIYRRKTE